jgi:hypothetical protein
MNNDKQSNNVKQSYSNKESYNEPELTVHGDVEEITQEAGSANSDVQPGIANTAFPLTSV